MALPTGAKWVYKAFGLPVPTPENAENPPMPLSTIEDELLLAETLIQSMFPAFEYPCFWNADTWAPSSGDAILYDAAVGFLAAAIITGLRTGGVPNVSGPQMVKRKLGDVEYTFKIVDPSGKAAEWQKSSENFMAATRCVGGDGTGGLDSITSGLLQTAYPNVNGNGRLTDNQGWPY